MTSTRWPARAVLAGIALVAVLTGAAIAVEPQALRTPGAFLIPPAVAVLVAVYAVVCVAALRRPVPTDRLGAVMGSSRVPCGVWRSSGAARAKVAVRAGAFASMAGGMVTYICGVPITLSTLDLLEAGATIRRNWPTAAPINLPVGLIGAGPAALVTPVIRAVRPREDRRHRAL